MSIQFSVKTRERWNVLHFPFIGENDTVVVLLLANVYLQKVSFLLYMYIVRCAYFLSVAN